jgi:hypothetical protein
MKDLTAGSVADSALRRFEYFHASKFSGSTFLPIQEGMGLLLTPDRI